MTAVPLPPATSGAAPHADTVRVRFWAAARAAAGTTELRVPVPADALSIDALREVVLEACGRPPGLDRVLGVCSVLIGDRPVTTESGSHLRLRPGDTVEFLPPFAGG